LPGIHAAGECTGIGGVDKALVEGELAAAALLEQPLAALQRRRGPQLAFARRLAQGFVLDPRLRTLADDRTLVCRCEDISWGELRQHGSWRAAKLQTRCGMGACQGRICGPITADCLGWESRGLRAPLQPVPLASLLPEEPAQDAG
jgi:NADPH-dependent 2,4-dienoyl-CoA reductase/sulfur reductase-like enzyme